MKNDFSQAELKLIKACSDHWHKLCVSDHDFCPPTVYDILCREMFIEDRKGPEVEALRRAMKAIHNCSPYRMTPEFDKLCEF